MKTKLKSILAGAVAAVGMTAAVTANAEPTLVVNGVTQSGGVATVNYTATGLSGYYTSNAKFVFEITANGTTKAFTNEAAVAEGAGTATVNFKSAFGNVDFLRTMDFHARIAGLVAVPTGPHGAPIPEAVQLWEGGPEWATWNVGASKPEEAGWYFWWGDTEGYVRNAADNGWVSAKDGTKTITFGETVLSNSTYGKDVATLQSESWIDSTGNLTMAHDAARVNLGGEWRMPTDAEIADLINHTTTTWTTQNGVYGRLVKGKGAYSNVSIFIPAANLDDGSHFGGPSSFGFCWSSTPYLGNSSDAWYLYFYSSKFSRGYNFRYYGIPVRPVRDLP